LIIRYAALFGVVLAFAALAFLGLLKGGTKLWFTLPKNPGWLDGSLWWVAVTAGAGVVVGVLRRVLRLPAKLPGTFKEIKEQRVEPATAPAAVVVSLVSLVGGASLGPEGALGKMGGGSERGSRSGRSSARMCEPRTPSAACPQRTAGFCHPRFWRRF
jgi:H+/Cl- antiporter ClcA